MIHIIYYFTNIIYSNKYIIHCINVNCLLFKKKKKDKTNV